MSASQPSLPTYRLHRATGQAVVTVRTSDGRRDIYLGRYNSPESKREYARIIALLTADPVHFRRSSQLISRSDRMSVSEAVLAYWGHARVYYRGEDDRPSSQVHVVRMALKPLVDRFGRMLIAELGPQELRAAVNDWVARGLARRTVNNYMTAVRVAVKWMTAEGMVSPDVLTGLQAMGTLRKHRTAARETEPRKPVPDSVIEATLLHLSNKQKAIIRLLRLTGMRPGEVLVMRAGDIDRSDERVWVYRPARHKTAHRGHTRTVMIGPRAQAVLLPWLTQAGEASDVPVFGLKRVSGLVRSGRGRRVVDVGVHELLVLR